jgi:hypothetical protein
MIMCITAGSKGVFQHLREYWAGWLLLAGFALIAAGVLILS